MSAPSSGISGTPASGPLAAHADPRPLPITGYVLAALGAALFSTKAIVIKLAYAEGISAETLLALRMSLSLPFYR